ncbi:Pentatricopeptide repeat-containing protein [Sesamum angolense]|uniref:Pentatricopeptide repeat-containing protein n=1 Tax=Sesamum angolense TaxID=2727404 RepID=A0AAE2C6K2_9LAMI|nr:Pentatricopeptide repeat-containing protein [Sesamum angolense]
MLLQPTTLKISPNYHHQNSNAVSFSSGLLQNSTFFLRQSILSISRKALKNPAFVTCSSISHVHSYGTVDYERRPMLKWNAIYKKISMLENPNMGSASVLNEVENEGKRLSKWELCRVVKSSGSSGATDLLLRLLLRMKFNRIQRDHVFIHRIPSTGVDRNFDSFLSHAGYEVCISVKVYEWMNNRAEIYRITTSDTAIQLDLIAKVHGISSAEKHFMKLPDALKDKRIYGSLLNAYVRARMREKAESLMDKMRIEVMLVMHFHST